MKEFKLPDLGEGIEAGDVVAVHVSEGDTIDAEQTVIEVETDKAVLEVPCPFGGKVATVHVSQGDTVKIGATILSVDVDGESEAPAESDEQVAKEDEEPAEKEEARSDEPEGAEAASRDEEAADEAKPAEKKPASDSKDTAEKKKSKEKPAPDQDKRGEGEPVPAGPATRRLARELGVDLSELAASKPGKRLTEEDVKAAVREGRRGADIAGTGVSAPPLPDFSQWGEVERKSLGSLQRKTADHMALGWHVAPHVTQMDEADVTALEALRKRYRDSGQGEGVKLTVTAFVLKALVVALKTYPQFNASLDSEKNELVYKKYYHLGVAVDTEAGLIVPVIRDVDKKGVLSLARELDELAERTRQRKIGLDELRGGTFTVTNLGGIGGTAFTPIINWPEVAILGVARGHKVPVLKDGQLTERMMMPLCLSYDHRVVNGADGARFTRMVASLLEDPELLLLGG